MCDASGANAVCGTPMAQIVAGASAGDDFIIPFCIQEMATVLVLLRTFDLHPGNIDENLHPRNVSNVAQEAARGGTLYIAMEEPGHPTQAYIVTQFEQLVRALVDFAYIHGAIVLRDGVYAWDATLPIWTHRPAAVEQWLRSKGCPIGDHHQIRPCQWLMAFMKPNPDGSKRYAAGESGPISSNLGRQLLNLVDYLDKVYDAGNRNGVKKTVRALRRLLVGERAARQ